VGKEKQEHRHHGDVVKRMTEVIRPESTCRRAALAPHCGKEIVMETAVDDLSAKEVHEDPGTTEKDHRAQDQGVVDQ